MIRPEKEEEGVKKEQKRFDSFRYLENNLPACVCFCLHSNWIDEERGERERNSFDKICTELSLLQGQKETAKAILVK